MSEPIKYEVDKESGALVVDRFLGTSMFYPWHYGFIPNTLSEDGDPYDVLVWCPYKLQPGCVISCRIIGLLEMEDEAGMDFKALAVPDSKLSPQWN
ncbi:inorganic pyrophosphatase, partial [bacterium]|nr:inorganic pyrophosphatase [bacterium]